MISINTLTALEQMLKSRSDPRWGEFMVLAQLISEVQTERDALVMAARVRQAPPPPPPDAPAPAIGVAPPEGPFNGRDATYPGGM